MEQLLDSNQHSSEHGRALLLLQLEAVEKARTAAEAELNTINDLPAALLRRAFSGEL